ncbi:hypothetical protein HYY73_06115 [Candidatus Woesearchaeota archaeon]|nr:hypothetical protein [Candidatus Woesearchaeota archaeon]
MGIASLPLKAVEVYTLLYGHLTDPVAALQHSGMDFKSVDGEVGDEAYRCEVSDGLERCIAALVPQPQLGKGAYSLSLVATSKDYSFGVLEKVLIGSKPISHYKNEREKLSLIGGLQLN